VSAVLLAAAIRARRFQVGALVAGAFPALADLLEFVLQLRQATPQFGVLRLQFGIFRLQLGIAVPDLLKFVHDPDNLRRQRPDGKRCKPPASEDCRRLYLSLAWAWT
jgi:hypothetical protein